MSKTNPYWRQVWGGATALLDRARGLGWIDVLVVVGLAGLLYGVVDLAGEWAGPHREQVEIDMSLWALPRYTFYSLCRGLIAYAVSLGFTLGYGYWAAKDRVADRVLIPLLDILQSIPVLGFLPGILLALNALFPTNNVGLEMASVLMIFTGQAWNMTFSFYHSLRSIPNDQQEVATLYRFSAWQRFKWVELPFSTMGLVWNSMMSMAGGWFFLMVTEAYHQDLPPGASGQALDFRLPGLGSYMSLAAENKQVPQQIWAIVAMTLMIVGLDQFLWRPVVAWAQKFRVEEGGASPNVSSWFLTWLRRSRLLALVHGFFHRWHVERQERKPRPAAAHRVDATRPSAWGSVVSMILFVILLGLLGYGAFRLVDLLRRVPGAAYGEIASSAGATLMRVLVSTALGTLWALPAGLAIGLSPRLSRILQPVVQVVASFPAPMLFPIIVGVLEAAGVSLGPGSIVLMLMGTQWYILFNVIAGSMAIPADLREAARSYRITGWKRFWTLYLPAVFPQLVTGWVTAAGGAWNTSIVAEFVEYNHRTLKTWGLGALINEATKKGDFPLLAASVLAMAAVVVAFNRTVWRRLYLVAEERFSLNK